MSFMGSYGGAMRILITNSNSLQTGYLAGKFPGAIGHLYSPGGQRGPYEFMPYALDNGAFGAWVNKRPFDESAWSNLLEWAKNSGQPPLWVLVPDVVADKDATLASWKRFAPIAAGYGWPLAFAVQDGMCPADVPSDADVIFVGGTTEWKWANAHRFGDRFNRVHIGRVNSLKLLRLAKNARAESCDGTGWLRGCKLQWAQLVHFLEEENSTHWDMAFPLFECRQCQGTGIIVHPGSWHESRCPDCQPSLVRL